MYSNPFLRSVGIAGVPCVISLTELFACWGGLRDFRHARGKRYALSVLLCVATLAKLAGCDHLQAIADWAREHVEVLCLLLGVERRSMPVLSTWCRVFAAALDPVEMTRVVRDYLQRAMRARVGKRGRIVVALDGKTLRGTIGRLRPTGVHLLAIYLPKEGIVLAQVEVGEKANEISMAPQVLAQIDLRGMVITGDAMFAQRELSARVVAEGGDYLWSVKDNQPRLREDIATVFMPARPTPGWGRPADDFDWTEESVGKGHGRLATRRLTASSLLQGYSDWPGLAQVFKLETTFIDPANGKKTSSLRYGITSLPRECADAQRLLALVHQHWHIESGLHYRRDVTFAEDRYHVRQGHAPHIMAVLNNLALGLLFRYPAPSVAAARRIVAAYIESNLARLTPSPT